MNVRFPNMKSSSTTALIEHAICFYVKKLKEIDDLHWRDITIDVVALDDHFLDATTGLPAQEGEAIMGAVFFDDENYNTSNLDVFNLGVWCRCSPCSPPTMATGRLETARESTTKNHPHHKI